MAEQMDGQHDWHGRTAARDLGELDLGELSWLATLVGRFERVSQSDAAAIRCDDAVLAACQRYLARPCAYAPLGAPRRLN